MYVSVVVNVLIKLKVLLFFWGGEGSLSMLLFTFCDLDNRSKQTEENNKTR